MLDKNEKNFDCYVDILCLKLFVNIYLWNGKIIIIIIKNLFKKRTLIVKGSGYILSN